MEAATTEADASIPDILEKEDLDRPLRRRVKTISRFLDMRPQMRGVRVNYLLEPSFRAWLFLAIPFYLLGIKKRLPLWRWLCIIIPHAYLLSGEMSNTAHEETIRSHKDETWHFRNAMDSASASVGTKALVAVLAAVFALFSKDPWADRNGKSSKS
jgi:diacylglycerol kinase